MVPAFLNKKKSKLDTDQKSGYAGYVKYKNDNL